jgi:DNA/RNA non-specific endonuclease
MADRTVQRREKRGPVRLQVNAGAAAGPRPRASRSDLKPGEVDYGRLDRLGRPTGIRAMLTAPLAQGTPANGDIHPPGWPAGTADHGMARGHLLGKQLGGDGNDPRNLVTLAQNPANSPAMRDFESAVRKAVEAGETVDYRVTPVYQGDNPMPVGITMWAQGDGNPPFFLEVSIINQNKTGDRFGNA